MRHRIIPALAIVVLLAGTWQTPARAAGGCYINVVGDAICEDAEAAKATPKPSDQKRNIIKSRPTDNHKRNVIVNTLNKPPAIINLSPKIVDLDAAIKAKRDNKAKWDRAPDEFDDLVKDPPIVPVVPVPVDWDKVACPAGRVPWLSGAFVGWTPNFRSLGAPVDFCTVFGGPADTWGALEKQVTTGHLPDAKRGGCTNYLFSLRIFPKAGPDSPRASGCQVWQQAANGAFDDHYIRLAQAMRSNLPANSIIRVGWELSLDSYPWNVQQCRTPQEAEWYKAGHKRIVDILRAHYSSSFKISWNWLRNGGRPPLPLQSYYPGDSYVDYVSVDYYDIIWDMSSVAKFNDAADRGSVTAPEGINKWLAFAKALGKPFSVDEWGVWAHEGKADFRYGGDNPAFIQGMYDFFMSNKDSLGYESYFNGAESTFNSHAPQSRQMYERLWGGRCTH